MEIMDRVTQVESSQRREEYTISCSGKELKAVEMFLKAYRGDDKGKAGLYGILENSEKEPLVKDILKAVQACYVRASGEPGSYPKL